MTMAALLSLKKNYDDDDPSRSQMRDGVLSFIISLRTAAASQPPPLSLAIRVANARCGH